MRRRALLAAAALLVGTAVLAPSAATAAPVSSCTSSTGVLVVVDLRGFGGSILRGCATAPGTGLDALHAAGFATEGTRRDGPGFVCRIDGRPDAGQEACYVTPSATSYWSYWHADAGQASWSYSTQGAATYRPHTGSVEAWTFGATDVGGTSGQPTFTPAQARAGSFAVGGTSAPRRTSPRSTPLPSTPYPGGSVVTGASAISTSAASAPRGTGPHGFPGGPAAGHSSASSASSGSSSGSGPASATSPGFVDTSSGAAAATAAPSGGSPVPVVIGVVLVALLAAGALWRRRAR